MFQCVVLLVEEELAQQAILGSIIKAEDFQVLETNNG